MNRERELEPGTLRLKRYPSRELYTSTYFAKKREFAETVGDSWMILSAEHGMLPPDQPVAPYETSIEDLTADQLDSLAAQVVDTLAEWCQHTAFGNEIEEIVVLAGRKYVDPLLERGAFGPSAGVRVRFPLQEEDLGGIGEQMRWLADRVESAEVAP